MVIRSFLRWTTALAILTALAFSNPAQAQQPTSAGGYKIGVVDMQRLIADYNKRAAKYEQLQREVESLQQEIDRLTSTIDANKQKYAASKNEDERFQLKQQIDTDFAKYRAELETRQATIDSKEEAVLKEVLGDIEKALDQVAKSGNYHLILNARTGGRSGVLYHDATIDITSQVLQVLNAGGAN